jgi:hypothetical protein
VTPFTGNTTIANYRPPRSYFTRPAAGAALAGLALALAACSGGGTTAGRQAAGGSLSAARAVGLAAQQAKLIRSYSIRLSTVTTGAVTDTISGTMQLRVKPSLLAGLHLTIGGSGVTQSVDEILTPKAVFIKLPGLGGLSKPWIRLSLTGGNAAGAAIGQLLQSIETSNPQNQTEMLTASKDLRKAGTQVINGIPTTRYTGSYSISAALHRLPAGLRRLSGAAVRSLGVSTVHFTIWIDGQHQTRKIVTAESGNGTTITSRLQIFAVNRPVHVTPPPGSQVAPAPAALKNVT